MPPTPWFTPRPAGASPTAVHESNAVPGLTTQRLAKVADRVSGVFVPAVIGIAVVTILVWLVAGQSIGFALARGISVLVISCPCALGLATPVASW